MSKNFNHITDRRAPYRIEHQRQAHGRFHVSVNGLSLAEGREGFSQSVARMRASGGGFNCATTQLRLVDVNGETLQHVDLARERRRARAAAGSKMAGEILNHRGTEAQSRRAG